MGERFDLPEALSLTFGNEPPSRSRPETAPFSKRLTQPRPGSIVSPQLC